MSWLCISQQLPVVAQSGMNIDREYNSKNIQPTRAHVVVKFVVPNWVYVYAFLCTNIEFDTPLNNDQIGNVKNWIWKRRIHVVNWALFKFQKRVPTNRILDQKPLAIETISKTSCSPPRFQKWGAKEVWSKVSGFVEMCTLESYYVQCQFQYSIQNCSQKMLFAGVLNNWIYNGIDSWNLTHLGCKILSIISANQLELKINFPTIGYGLI